MTIRSGSVFGGVGEAGGRVGVGSRVAVSIGPVTSVSVGGSVTVTVDVWLGSGIGVGVQDGGSVAASRSRSTAGGEVGAGVPGGAQAAAMNVIRVARLSIRGSFITPPPFVIGYRSTRVP